MWTNEAGMKIAAGDPYTSPDGTQYPNSYPKELIPDLWAYVPTVEEEALAMLNAKSNKRHQINLWRAQANQTSFTYEDKQIACDALSRADIDGVAGEISLNGSFPSGFPGAWKAMDDSYIMLPTIEAFKAMYSAMTLQGTINFGRSQTLKAAVEAAATIEELDALAW